jgi:hypothetical protein
MARRMEIEAVHRPPLTRRPHLRRRVFPYLSRGQLIDPLNNVCALDIPYLPMKRVAMYLVTEPK